MAAAMPRPASGRIHSMWVIVDNPPDAELDSIWSERCFGCIGTAFGLQGLLVSFEEALFAIAELSILEVQGLQALEGEAHEDSFFRVCSGFVRDFPKRYAAYRMLRLQGWVVRLGALKFGADFMLYDGSPDKVHARYIVIIAEESAVLPLRWRDVLMGSRLAGAVAKDLALVLFRQAEEGAADDSAEACGDALRSSSGRGRAGTRNRSRSSALTPVACAPMRDVSGCSGHNTLRQFLASPSARARVVAVKKWSPHVA